MPLRVTNDTAGPIEVRVAGLDGDQIIIIRPGRFELIDDDIAVFGAEGLMIEAFSASSLAVPRKTPNRALFHDGWHTDNVGEVPISDSTR